MDEEVEACSRIYTAKLNELEAKSGIRASHRSVVLANLMLSVGSELRNSQQVICRTIRHQVPWISRKNHRVSPKPQ